MNAFITGIALANTVMFAVVTVATWNDPEHNRGVNLYFTLLSAGFLALSLADGFFTRT